MSLSLLLLLAAQTAAPTPAASVPTPAVEPVCIRAGDLPRPFARWNDPASPALKVGAPFVVTAASPAGVKWVVPPTRPGNGAVVMLRVARAGLYSVELSNGAYVDVLLGKIPVQSVAHGHGPACTGLRKMVDFHLSRGSYTLQLSGMPQDSVKIMIVSNK